MDKKARTNSMLFIRDEHKKTLIGSKRLEKRYTMKKS